LIGRERIASISMRGAATICRFAAASVAEIAINKKKGGYDDSLSDF
jgi:hypothetical protein